MLLLPGCIVPPFSEHDYGCPDKVLMMSVQVRQNLTGTWDIERAWASMNNTTARTEVYDDRVGHEDMVSGYQEKNPYVDGWMVGVDERAPEANGSRGGIRATMFFDFTECVDEPDHDETLEGERQRHSATWTRWRDRFWAKTALEPRSPESWKLA